MAVRSVPRMGRDVGSTNEYLHPILFARCGGMEPRWEGGTKLHG